eukprot:g6798.t1
MPEHACNEPTKQALPRPHLRTMHEPLCELLESCNRQPNLLGSPRPRQHCAKALHNWADDVSRCGAEDFPRETELKKTVALFSTWCRSNEQTIGEDAALLEASCRGFQLFLGRDAEADGLALNKGMMGCVTEWLRAGIACRPIPSAALQQAISLATTLAQPRDSDKVVQMAGTVLLELLKLDHDVAQPRVGPPEVPTPLLEDAITALALLLVRSRHKRMVGQAGGIPLAIHLLKLRADVPELVVAVCRFLSNFQDKEQYREVVFQHGGHVALQSAFSAAVDNVEKKAAASSSTSLTGATRGPPEDDSYKFLQILRIRAACLEALWNCVIDNEKVVEMMYMDAFLDTNLPPCLLEYLAFAEQIFDAGGSLAVGLSTATTTDEQSGGSTSPAEQGEKDDTSAVERQLFSLLAKLLEASFAILRRVAKSQKCRSICVALPYLEMAQRALRIFPDAHNLGKEICGMLGNLALDPEWRKDVLQMGFVPAVVDLCATAGTEDRKTAKIAFSALANLAHDDPARQLVVRAGVIPVLLQIVRANLRNEMVVESAVSLMSHLAPDAVCADELRVHAGVEMAFVVLQEHAEDLLVVKRCLLCFRRLLQSDANERMAECMKKVGGETLILVALKQHHYDDVVVKEVMQTASLLPMSDDTLMTVSDVLLKALEIHSHDPEVMKLLGNVVSRLPISDEALVA